MRSIKIILILCAIFITSAYTPEPKKVSLVVAEYDVNSKNNHMQHLVKYVYKEGAFISSEEIISVPTEKKDSKENYVRFDIGRNRIYRNRYVITGIGNVIDIKTKKLLVEERGEFIAFNGDSIIFRTNDIFKGQYYSVLNLKTEKFGKVEDPTFNPLPRPDVEFDDTKTPFTISAYDVAGKKTLLVNDAGFGEAPSKEGKKKSPAIFWLDNTNFLYAKFSADHKSAAIYKVGLNKSAEKIGQIDAIPVTDEPAHFEMNADKSPIFACANGRYMIMLKEKVVCKIDFESIGNNFSVESEANPKYGRIVQYRGYEIGRKWCRIENSRTIDGYAAFQIDIVIGTEHYPQGIETWNVPEKKWTKLDVPYLEDIVGWVEE